ncbi:MAG: adenylate kinase [Gammaproteobacteria bacterium]|nr:adenylate kinase [Gammaproteobacteria bacterium]
MRLILLGSPGAGKGTQAQYIVKRYGIVQIATGDMLRHTLEAKNDLSVAVKRAMDAGELVSDELMIAIVKARLLQSDCKAGFLLDGFPRTLAQAEALHQNDVQLDYVIEVKVDEQTILERLTGRRVHPGSGRSYHLIYHPPKNPGVDDVTGEPLIQRKDDEEQTVRRRLAVYREQTMPLVGYYQQWALRSPEDAPRYYQINGDRPVEVVRDEIISILDSKKASADHLG